MDVSFDMEKISDELEKIEKTMNLLNSNGSKEEKSGYWTRMVKVINRVFLICYIIAVTVFLGTMFSLWRTAED